MKPARLLLGTAALLLLGSGCAGLHLTTIKASEQRPSNVAVYFKVETRTGDPIGGLTADQFRIYEDGQLVSQYESKQTILNPEVAAVHYTLLLVDMSGSVSESGTGDTLVQAVGTFSGHVEKQQKVGIYAFDGSPDLYPIVPFTDQAGNAKAGVQQLATFKPKDPSTNLNGAVLKALDELDNALGKATQPLKFGTLVVFTDGTDRANRIPASKMQQHVHEKPFDVFAIGLGAELKEPQLEEIGKSGTAMATDRNAIVKAFDDIGGKVEQRTKSYYLLSYCSPSRAGQHVVRVEAVYKNPQGTDQTGSLESSFDAT
ncbi:MAG: vWA domain-containing protein, partial [Polyangiaceae bacterium]